MMLEKLVTNNNCTGKKVEVKGGYPITHCYFRIF